MLGVMHVWTKQLCLTLCGLSLALLAVSLCGCNQGDDAAEMAARMAAMNSSKNQPVTQAAPVTQQAPVPVQDLSAEATEEGDQEYTGPLVDVTEFTVKLPYEGYEGAKRFDITVSVQAQELVSSKAIWKIIALDAEGEVVGSQQLHLAIPADYPKPLDINSFYCTAVPASLEFQMTNKEASRAGEEGSDDGGGSAVRSGIR